MGIFFKKFFAFKIPTILSAFFAVYFFVTILLACCFQFNRESHSAYKSLGNGSRTNILGFSSKATLSSDYYLLAPEDSVEIQFFGEKENRILMGGKLKESFLNYLSKAAVSRENRCALTILTGREDVAWAIIYSNENYIFFGGENSLKASKSFIEEICENKKNGIRWNPRPAID